MDEPVVHRPVVLIAEELSPATVDALGPGVEVRHCAGADRAALLAALPGADAVLIRSATRMDAEALAAADRLRVIGRAGVGLDNVDVPAASAAGVMVVNAPISNVVSAAELAVGLLVAVARNIPQADAALKAGRWQRSRFSGVELAGKTLGLLGLGRIGTLVARRMRAFEMDVIAYDPYVQPAHAAQEGVTLVPLEELLERSELISVHLPRTPETTGLLGFEALHRVRPGVRIVNAARGGIVDEAELYAALKEGRVAAAGIDVFAVEPCPESPLFELDSVVVTPHLGAGTAEAQERAGVSVAGSVRRALAGALLPEAVNVRAGAIAPDLAPWLVLTERLAGLLVAATGRLPGRLAAVARGEIAGHDVRVLELGALKGALTGPVEGGVSYVNAPALASGRGLEAVATTGPDALGYRSAVTLRAVFADGSEASVTGTLTEPGGRALLVEIFGLPIDFPLGGEAVFFRCPDRAGVLGALGAALGAAGVNIAAMRLARTAPGGDAVVALSVDAPVRPEPLAEAAGDVRATRWWTLGDGG
ncbi:phosphoglycerate dehydrogenase [Streptomyces cucumeris]|uniref:phosphoglycerate dehydrogenase n=1 Tax=Streptomyces cucumeris TaxID=2962890 RepID=UPI003D713C68